LKHIETSGAIEKLRLIRLEFGLNSYSWAISENKKPNRSTDAIMSNPKLFCDVLCMLYKPASDERETPPSEAERGAPRQYGVFFKAVAVNPERKLMARLTNRFHQVY